MNGGASIFPLRNTIPLSSLEQKQPPPAGTVIFHCRSGNRTAANAKRLAATVPGAKVYLLDGGLRPGGTLGFQL